MILDVFHLKLDVIFGYVSDLFTNWSRLKSGITEPENLLFEPMNFRPQPFSSPTFGARLWFFFLIYFCCVSACIPVIFFDTCVKYINERINRHDTWPVSIIILVLYNYYMDHLYVRGKLCCFNFFKFWPSQVLVEMFKAFSLSWSRSCCADRSSWTKYLPKHMNVSVQHNDCI